MIDLAHIHPMLVHFPLALLPVALCVQIFALYRRVGLFGRSCPATMAVVLLVLAALAAIVAAVFGDMALDHALDTGVPLASMEEHEELGQATAVLLAVLAGVEGWCYWKSVSGVAVERLLLLAGFMVLAVLLVTAWFGGHLVYDLGVNVLVPVTR
jgi:uncharacterized membrane protein